MKKTFTLLVLISISFTGFAQTADSGSYDELMRKSRSARTISTIMVSTGPVIAVGGVSTLIYGLIENEVAEPTYIYDANGGYTIPAKKYTTEIAVGAIAAAVGIAVAVSSVVFSSRARNLKREARKLKIKTAADHFSIPGLQNSFANTRITQYKLSLLIPLGR